MPRNYAKYQADLNEANALKKANQPLEERHERALATYNRKLDNRKAGRQAKKEQGMQEAAKTIAKVSPQAPTIKSEPKLEESTRGREKPRTLSNYPNAINEDTTNHDALGEIHMHLSDSLTNVPSHMTRNIDSQLNQGYNYLAQSRYAHNAGKVTEAKDHMTKAGRLFGLVTSEMSTRGVLKNSDKIKNFINLHTNSYVKSTLPGAGSAPHENFVAPKKRSTIKKSEVITTTSDSLANSFDALPSDHEIPSSLGQQFKEQGGYRTGKEHMDSAVIGMMEGRY
jgi:hypothetical protein